jgi:hypothetical protein
MSQANDDDADQAYCSRLHERPGALVVAHPRLIIRVSRAPRGRTPRQSSFEAPPAAPLQGAHQRNERAAALKASS